MYKIKIFGSKFSSYFKMRFICAKKKKKVTGVFGQNLFFFLFLNINKKYLPTPKIRNTSAD